MKAKLFWVRGPWPGRLAVMPGPRGGDWLDDEMKTWRDGGVDIVVSLLTRDEADEFDLIDEALACNTAGMQYILFPIADRTVPKASRAFTELLTQLGDRLSAGKNIAIHCRQGIGRAALVASCLLVLAGLEAEEAISRVTEARGCSVPETKEQRDWIVTFVNEIHVPI